MSTRVCEVCGKTLPLQTGRGGRRKRCATCPRPRGKARPRTWTPKEILTPPTDLDGPQPTCERTRALLLAAGVWDHPMASVAMRIAERIDSGQEPGAALASLSKQLGETLALLQAAAEQQPAEPDPIEEFRRRRRIREAGA